ncbi:MAG TPA: ABC transporter substrate-binding protein [Trebonia sp.]
MTRRFTPERDTGSRQRRRFRVAAAAAAAAAATVLAACGSSGSSGSGPVASGSASGLVTGSFGSGATFTADFNPYSPSAQDPTFGMIYEPLMFFDTAQAGTVNPWLAASYAWGAGGKSITFQLRHGVKWNDGQPFTSADVAYTFNLEKSNPALDNYGLPITGATASGPYTVTISFAKPVYTDLYYIAGKVSMLPQHIWSKIKNPATFTDPNPVGTGAYAVSKVTPQVLELTANPHYYLPGLPKVKNYEFLTYSSNTTYDAALESGQLGWGGGFVPNVNKTYLARNSKFALVDFPLAVDYLIPNMAKGPTTALAVRQAISDAIDRNYISQSVYNGYAPSTNPEGLLLPNFKNIASPQTASDKFGGANPAQSKQILKTAGYKLGSNGIFSTPGGQPLNLDVKVVSGYTDYLSILQILQPELKAAGINLQITAEAYSVWATDQDTGNFQLLLSNAGYTPIPYSFYYNLLDSAVTKPLGTSEAVGDYGRYTNPQVNTLLSTIAGTTDTATQNQAFYQIESIFKAQLPDIPLMEAQDEIEFDGSSVSGWPTQSNPWAAPAIWLSPDDGWVAARLAPASKK